MTHGAPRRIRSAITVAAIAATVMAGCRAYKPLPAPGSAVGKMVRVQYAAPRDLMAVRASGGDTLLRAVTELRGNVTAVSGDTLSVSLERVSDAAGEHPVRSSMSAAVVTESSVAIDVLKVDEGRTAVVAAGTIYVVATLAVVALYAALVASYR